jgi:hypothetical protein
MFEVTLTAQKPEHSHIPNPLSYLRIAPALAKACTNKRNSTSSVCCSKFCIFLYMKQTSISLQNLKVEFNLRSHFNFCLEFSKSIKNPNRGSLENNEAECKF